uniref:Glycosyltransferase n=1 Tax=Leersia perrieri TaxID=77586 RepID=A0A0D9W319_9ORYZ
MSSSPKKHVVLFPFPGRGHLTAFLSLAGLLRRVLLPSATMTLVSTQRNVDTLRATAADAPFLNLHTLPFSPTDHGLPPGHQSSDVRPALTVRLYEAFETLQPAFDSFVSELISSRAADDDADVVVVVSDVFVAWTVEVARRHGCRHAFFVSCGAFGSAVLHSLWSHLPLYPDELTGRVLLPEYPDVFIHRSQVSKYTLAATGATTDGRTTYFDRQLRHGYQTDAVLVNTVAELEPDGLAMLRRTLKVPVWPVGPLTRAADAEPHDDDAVLRWMDAQPPRSVLYVSFGTDGTIRAEHMLELAAALKSSGRRFVWKINDADDVTLLPEGFEERARTEDTGFLIHGWAPQVRILAHASTGAFLSHCGWNSVLESVSCGVPMVGWPLSAEQFYNVMVLEELGVCVEVARGKTDDTVVERKRLAEVMETVMGETAKGDDMRRRVWQVRKVMVDAWKEDGGSSMVASQAFLEAMRLK